MATCTRTRARGGLPSLWTSSRTARKTAACLRRARRFRLPMTTTASRCRPPPRSPRSAAWTSPSWGAQKRTRENGSQRKRLKKANRPPSYCRLSSRKRCPNCRFRAACAGAPVMRNSCARSIGSSCCTARRWSTGPLWVSLAVTRRWATAFIRGGRLRFPHPRPTSRPSSRRVTSLPTSRSDANWCARVSRPARKKRKAKSSMAKLSTTRSPRWWSGRCRCWVSSTKRFSSCRAKSSFPR